MSKAEIRWDWPRRFVEGKLPSCLTNAGNSFNYAAQTYSR